jgi:hypothetical protein
MRVRTIFLLWLPLAVSFELMMVEGPVVQSAMGRLANPSLNLAAWGLTMGLSLLVESPVIMLLATAIALVKDGHSYFALRRFTVILAAFCTVLAGLVAFTPLFGFIGLHLMGVPAPIVRAAQPAMQVMLFWTAAIAWRRFYQGVLVRHGATRMVTWGTAIRLVATVATAWGLAHSGLMSGVELGAWALMAAVVAEALATTFFALPIIRRDVLPIADAGGDALTQRGIFKFHAPLAATTLLVLLAQPVTAAALAHLPLREDTLAAWPVTYMLLLVIRGWGLALQEITVAQHRYPEARAPLRRFTWIIGGLSTGVTALIAFTPLLDVYMNVLHVPGHLQPYVRVGMATGVALPMITALGSWARGVLVAERMTKAVYLGMGINLMTHASLLLVGVLLKLPGMLVASGAFTLASVGEYVYLVFRIREVARPLVVLMEEPCAVGGQ